MPAAMISTNSVMFSLPVVAIRTLSQVIDWSGPREEMAIARVIPSIGSWGYSAHLMPTMKLRDMEIEWQLIITDNRNVT